MGKTLIVYESSGGSCRRYADMLASAVGGVSVPARRASEAQVRDADTVALVGWIMAGSLKGADFLRKHARALQSKKTAVIAVGLARKLDEAAWQKFEQRAFTEEMRAGWRVFYLRGAYRPEERGFFTRAMMNLLVRQLEKKPDPSEEERELISAVRHGADYVRAEALAAAQAYLA